MPLNCESQSTYQADEGGLSLDLTKHLKIWFDSPGHEGPLLGNLNKKRLLSHRITYPSHYITLIFSGKGHSAEKVHELREFAEVAEIHLIDISELEQALRNSNPVDLDLQLALLKYAREEIELFYGNMAVASDIVRALSPCLARGLYTDFDVIINPEEELPETLQLKYPYLFTQDLNINGYTLSCNNILWCDETKSDYMKKYRNILFMNVYTDRLHECISKNPGIFCKSQIKGISSRAIGLLLRELNKMSEGPIRLRDIQLYANTGKLTSIAKAFLPHVILFCTGPELTKAAERSCSDTYHEIALLTQYYSLSIYLLNESDLSWLPTRTPEYKQRLGCVTNEELALLLKQVQNNNARGVVSSVVAVDETEFAKIHENKSEHGSNCKTKLTFQQYKQGILVQQKPRDSIRLTGINALEDKLLQYLWEYKQLHSSRPCVSRNVLNPYYWMHSEGITLYLIIEKTIKNNEFEKYNELHRQVNLHRLKNKHKGIKRWSHADKIAWKDEMPDLLTPNTGGLFTFRYEKVPSGEFRVKR